MLGYVIENWMTKNVEIYFDIFPLSIGNYSLGFISSSTAWMKASA